MEAMRKRWFRPAQAGWDPHFYERYFASRLGAAIRAREEDAVYGFLGTVLRPEHRVLEVGCGTGNYTVPVARRSAEVVAIDSSPEMLQYLRGRLRREGLTNVEVRPGRLPDRLVAAPGGFDGALVIGTLNYTPFFEESLRALASALKPGGWVVFNVPLPTVEGCIYALSELLNRRRVYLLSPETIVDLAERAGLRVEETATAGLGRDGLTLVVGALLAAAPPGKYS